MVTTELRMTRGDVGPRWRVTITRPIPGSTAREPLPLTGCTLTFTARTAYNAETVVFTKVIDEGIEVEDESGGIIVISLEAVDTESLSNRPTKLVFDLEVIDTLGGIETVAKGELWIEPEVTFGA